MTPRLVLASASPRRQELLRNANIPFVAMAANVVEQHRANESPRDYVLRLAKEKSEAVAKIAPVETKAILGADTEVVLDLDKGLPLGKPHDAEDAIRMLRALRSRSHYVITGVCLMWRADGAWSPAVDSETTIVHVGEISDEEIRAYVAIREPMDKAGAYAIQGIASRWIPRIEGCYFNVVGLPVPLVYRMLLRYAPSVFK
jgi:septum formation protein